MANLYAVELFSVRDELYKDLWGTLRKIKQMGYEGVEFFGEFRWTAQEVAAALDDTGLVCCGWHTPWNYLSEANLFGTVSYNKAIGNTDIVVPSLPKEMTGSKQAWIETAEKFKLLAERLAAYGMHLGYHNHSAEFKPMEGDIPYHYFYDNAGPRVGMQLDNGNAWGAGPETDIYDPLVRYPGRAKTLHLKPRSLTTGSDTMIGEDDIDWPKFFELSYAHQPNVEWYVVEFECEARYTQLEGVEACIKALKKMEAEEKI